MTTMAMTASSSLKNMSQTALWCARCWVEYPALGISLQAKMSRAGADAHPPRSKPPGPGAYFRVSADCSLKIGMKIERTIPPTTSPMRPIISGSIRLVSDSTVAETWSS